LDDYYFLSHFGKERRINLFSFDLFRLTTIIFGEKMKFK
jgi:hypothetical protein